jgi:PAS domain S-box-containing protein
MAAIGIGRLLSTDFDRASTRFATRCPVSIAPILVVVRNAAIRAAIGEALQAHSYAVLEADSGERALQLATEQAPALVLLDCSLADMDGFEVARRLRTGTPSLPVIGIAGWAQANEARVLTAGFLDVLVKPIDTARMVESVERHLARGAPRSAHFGKTVLLVDDDPPQRRLAELALSSAGFVVAVAEDGAAALRLATANVPDVIVSDVLMPEMDGFALCKTIRRNPSLAQVPIVLMSSHYLEDEDRALAVRFGANRCVSRGNGFDVVVRSVLEAMDAPIAELTVLPSDELQPDYLRRIANQLERQASIGIGLAHRFSLQATAQSILDGLSDSLARELNPERRLDATLATCLDAAGLSVGAILLLKANGELKLEAEAGSRLELPWVDHAAFLHRAIDHGGMTVPSVEAGEAGEALLAILGAGSALVVPISAREDALGALVLASNGADLAGAEGEGAARAARSVSRQLGQALALSRMFSKLASAEQRYRALLENAYDGISISTPDGVVLEVNRRMEELLGHPRNEVIGRHIADFAAEGRAEGNVATYNMAVIGRGTGADMAVIGRPDGTEVQVEFSSTVVEVGGERCVFSIGRDVSDRLRLEEQLRQSLKMEAIGKLAGGIAHDFNNVLSVVLCYSEVLLDELKPTEPIRADILEIHKAGKRAADLTQQLLMFSRQQVIAPKVLNLNGVLTDIDKMLQRILGADVDLVSVPMQGLGHVRVDPGSIEQVIMNLVVNARDAMPAGGKLTMETANVVLDDVYVREHHEAKAGPYVMLAVTDTGCGMTKATLARIFEPFYTTKEVGKGTGLGLSTAFGIVHQSGGNIWVYSELGKGTTVKIYLPRVDAAIDEIRVNEPSRNLRGSETVLLVEDDEQVRAVILGILRAHGYFVMEARNAGEAVMLSEKHAGAIQLLLSDVVMPHVSGPELAKKLAAARPEMKVLYVSGYADDSVVRHGLVDANTAFLQKPITPGRLTTKLRDVLDGPGSFTGSASVSPQ